MQAYRDQMTSFIAAINGEPTPAGAPQIGLALDGRAAVAACCAIVASSQQRRWIDLPIARGDPRHGKRADDGIELVVVHVHPGAEGRLKRLGIGR